MIYDLVVAGGAVALPGGVVDCDIAVRGERIAAIGEPGSFRDAAAVVNAAGRLVVPGGIDPHVHCSLDIYNPSGGPPIMGAGPDVVGNAAIYGGTTTLIDFVKIWPDDDARAKVRAQVERWSESSPCDYSFHVWFHDRIPAPQHEQIPELITDGFPSFKVFITDGFPAKRGRKVSMGTLLDLYRVTAEHGGIVAVHAEDDDLVMHAYDRMIPQGNVHFSKMSHVHSGISEDLAFTRIISLLRHVPGAALYLMHVSAKEGVAAIRNARREGLAVYGETLHQYALHTEADYLRPNGQQYHTYPSLKSEEDTAAIWSALVSGDLSVFATDELCTSLEEKLRGDRIDNTIGGNAGIEPRMAILYTEIVQKRDLGVEKFVELSSTSAAKLMGMYPQKGAIMVGSDADLAVLDVGLDKEITAADLHETDYTPWEGWRVAAWPSSTILRGQIRLRDGQLVEPSAKGKVVHRRLAPTVNSGRIM